MKFLITLILTSSLFIATMSGIYYITTKEIIFKGIVISHSADGNVNGYVNYYTTVRLDNGEIMHLKGSEFYLIPTGDSLHYVTRIPKYKYF